MEEIKRLLPLLCQAPGLPGREDPVRQVLQQELQALGCTVHHSPMGSLWTTLGQGDGHLLLDAHMDQIGLLVTRVEADGFLRVGKSGGVDRRVQPGTHVTVYGQEVLQGIVCCLPPHLTDGGGDTVPPVEEMAVDVGLSGEEAARLIHPGDSVTIPAPVIPLLHNRVTGAALDDRAGCAVLVRCAQLLAGKKLTQKVTLLFSSREEVGSQGAETAAFSLRPDRCIAVDVTFASQPGVSEKESGELGAGPMVGIAPVLSRQMARQLLTLSQREGIPVQTEVMNGPTGTTADRIMTTGGGVPCCLLSIPQRSMHTPGEVCDLRDMESAARLLAAYAQEE